MSLEGRKLKAERHILHRDGRMTLKRSRAKRNTNRIKVGIEPRFLDWKAIKVKPLPENRILANHSQDRNHTSESRALLDGPLSIVFMSNS